MFKGFTVCSQGRQQWLTAALSLLGMPVVAVLPSSSLTHLEYTEANFPLKYGGVNLFSVVQRPTVKICVLFTSSFRYLVNKEKIS